MTQFNNELTILILIISISSICFILLTIGFISKLNSNKYEVSLYPKKSRSEWLNLYMAGKITTTEYEKYTGVYDNWKRDD